MKTKEPTSKKKPRPKPKPRRCRRNETPPKGKRPLTPRQAELARAYVESGSVTRAAETAGYTREGASRALSRAHVREALAAALRRRGLDEASIVGRLISLADDAQDVETDESGAVVKSVRRAAVQLGAVRVMAAMLVPDHAPPSDEQVPFFSPVEKHGFDRIQNLVIALLAAGDPDNPVAQAIAGHAATLGHDAARVVEGELVTTESGVES